MHAEAMDTGQGEPPTATDGHTIDSTAMHRLPVCAWSTGSLRLLCRCGLRPCIYNACGACMQAWAEAMAGASCSTPSAAAAARSLMEPQGPLLATCTASRLTAGSMHESAAHSTAPCGC